MRVMSLGLVGVALALSVLPASSHHSFAMFDNAKFLNLEGTVTEFQWTNPHSWILLTVTSPQRINELWSIEIGTPSGLARQGWVPKMLTPGMKINATINPLKDGKHGGRAITVTLPDGTRKLHPFPLGGQYRVS